MQMFTQDGDPLGQWPTKLIGPATVFVDGEDVAYVPEHNGGLFSVLTLEGERVAQWGSEVTRACHGVWADSHRDVYFVQPGSSGGKRKVVKYHRV